ncbi:MAG TPA: DMT family transporter, partial [Salinimicrobium sp.]|nr:DMT family transporter [Salinimicrobium sp.]
MAGNNLKWIYLLLLSLVWGSSFILIKKGLLGLTALQVGSLRIVFAAFFMVIIGLKSLRQLKKSHWKWLAITGFFGTFFPAYLFAIAETEIDSAIVSILNSTTPLLAMCLGIFIFRAPFVKRKFVGVMVGLVGATALILSGAA